MAKYEEGAKVTLLANTDSVNLADGSLKVIPYDNTGEDDLWLWANIQLALRYDTSAPAAGTAVAELYLLPKVSNYPEGSSSLTPQAALLVGVFESRDPKTHETEHLILPAIPLTPAEMYFVIKNISGETFAGNNGGTGWAFHIIPFRTQK